MYAVGYGTEMVTMSELQRRFGPGLEPEYARRLWAWIESAQRRIGVGTGERGIPS